MKQISREIINRILDGRIDSPAKIDSAKKKLAKEYGVIGIIRNSKILEYATEEEKEKLSLLTKKPVRTISGVSVVAVMTKPHECPGRCIYCPGGESSPKSYTGEEPAARRAAMFEYNPCTQVKERIKQLEAIGHPADKIELIIMGGTLPSCSLEYQKDFVRGCFDGMNEIKSKSLEEAQLLNETAEHRNVGITIETRPDFCKEEHINNFLKLGATRVELGVQALSDRVYEKINRGHTISDVIDATCFLKQSAYKIAYHMMPGLFQAPEEDLRMFRKLFSDERFMPDMIKIYPVLVVKGTKLYEMWKKKQYEPLDNETAAGLIAKMKAEIPPWVRVMRIQRDIPANLIEGGVKASNLRELVHDKMAELGLKCRCIRCREIGHRQYKEKVNIGKIKLKRTDYKASKGKELFLSYEDEKTGSLIGFVRLRMNSGNSFRKEITEKTAMIRELHVYGSEVSIGRKDKAKYQHQEYGKRLLEEAERTAKEEFDMKDIVVLSAVGTREYYKKFGYEKKGEYMWKNF